MLDCILAHYYSLRHTRLALLALMRASTASGSMGSATTPFSERVVRGVGSSSSVGGRVEGPLRGRLVIDGHADGCAATDTIDGRFEGAAAEAPAIEGRLESAHTPTDATEGRFDCAVMPTDAVGTFESAVMPTDCMRGFAGGGCWRGGCGGSTAAFLLRSALLRSRGMSTYN